MPRLVHIMTVADSLGFVGGQISYMADHGFDVHVVTSPGEKLDAFARSSGVKCHAVEMPRAMTPLEDLRAITELTDLLVDLDPDIAHAHTPKGGLLGMISATLAMVPVRVYHMRGLLTFTATGFRKRLFENAERTSCGLAHHVIAQSNSLRKHAVSEKLVSKSKISILANGSNGVDAANRFNPKKTNSAVRKELGIKKSAPVVGFVGRLVRDKGIRELVDAWTTVIGIHPDAKLLIVGPLEERDALPSELVTTLKTSPSIHMVPFTTDTPSYYAAMDTVVLPSYREGFPNVPLEAAAMGKPVIVSTVPGCVDAVQNGVTGTWVPAKSSDPLARAISAYIDSPKLAKSHGDAGRKRALTDFDPQLVFAENLKLYQRLLDKHARRR